MWQVSLRAILILTCLFATSYGRLIIFDGDNAVANYSTGLIIYDGLIENPPQRIIAPVCTEGNAAAGCIVLFFEPPPPERIARRMQAINAAAVVTGNNGYHIGFANTQVDNDDTSDIWIPTYDVPSFDMDSLLLLMQDLQKKGANLTGVLEYEPDDWVPAMNSWLVTGGQVVLGAELLTNLILAVIVWIRFFRVVITRRVRAVIPHIVLSFVIIASILQLGGLPDIAGFRRIYPWAAKIVLFTAPSPFILSAVILMTFAWHECLSQNSLKVNAFLDRAKIPFFIACGVFFGLIITSILMRTLTLANYFSYIEISIWVLVSMGLAIFFIVTAVRVFKQIQKSSSLSENKRANSTKITRSLIFIAATLLHYTLSIIVSAGLFAKSPYYVIALYFWMYISIHLICLSIIIAFMNAQKSWNKGPGTTRVNTNATSEQHSSQNA